MSTLKSKFRIFLFLVPTALCLLASCDETTNDIGIYAMPYADVTNTSQAVFNAYSKSVKVDSLIANTPKCYLGKVTDPETGMTTTCNFATQFFRNEAYKLPKKELLVCDDNGNIICDSVILTIYIESYYGDSLNPIKFAVYELDSSHVMEENTNYYTSFNPEPYISKKEDAIYKVASYAVTNLEESDSVRSLYSYLKQINIKLPTSFGVKLLSMYYEHPEYYRNTYAYTHHVFPGFYFKHLSGNGSMIGIDASVLSCFFKFTVADSTHIGIEKIAATEEVLQNNSISNKGVDTLLTDNSCTYLKTPAGIFTEVTLPIDEIFANHEKDSINSAHIVFQKINNSQLTKYNLKAPSQLLLLPKTELKDFFENKALIDGKKEFVTTFNSLYNSYTYDNIGTLITWMRNQMRDGAGIKSDDDAVTAQIKHDTWVASNPDWDKVVLVPIKSDVSPSGYTKIYNEFELTSTKLVGGETPIHISIVYGHFNK